MAIVGNFSRIAMGSRSLPKIISNKHLSSRLGYYDNLTSRLYNMYVCFPSRLFKLDYTYNLGRL